MKSNPLSTRYVEPGKLAWRAPSGPSLDELANRFIDKLDRRAAIVGPHGSGKSTLLENLVPLLGSVALRAAAYKSPDSSSQYANSDDAKASVQAPAPVVELERDDQASQRIVWLKMRGRSQSRRLLFETYRAWACRDCILVIDGYEQLSSIARGAALILTRIAGAGLLITSHRKTALATLVETRVDAGLAQELLDQLLPPELPDRGELLDAGTLQQLLDKHQGNLREVFMELYDRLH